MKDFSVQERNQFEYYDPSETFGLQDNFNVAVAFVPYEYDNLPIEDPAIGELKFVKKVWGYGDDIEFLTELDSHYCNATELKESGYFFPLSPLSVMDVENY